MNRSSSCPTGPESELELEPRVRIGQLVADQLAEASEAVADRLRMEVEGTGHRRRVAAVLHVGERRLLHPRPTPRGELRERVQPALGETLGEGGAMEEEEIREVFVGPDQAV